MNHVHKNENLVEGKKREVPPHDIDQALERKQFVEADFEKFTFRPE